MEMFRAATSGDAEWLQLILSRTVPPLDTDHQGLTVLHVACLHSQLACIKLLVASCLVDINASCPEGRRPVHMLLTAPSARSPACLQHLLEHGAEVNVATDSGLSPLHLAAYAGLLKCTQILVQAGADVYARDNMGLTALDTARIYCHRATARCLKASIWQADKRKELEMRKEAQNLYQRLVDMAKQNDHREKMLRQLVMDEKRAEWANEMGLPVLPPSNAKVLSSRFHTRCLSPEQGGPTPSHSKGPCKRHPEGPGKAWNVSTNPTKPPPASVSRPQTVRASGWSEKPPAQPDLRRSVTLCRTRGGEPRYVTKWDGLSRAAPNLPLDVLQRELFPHAYPPRLPSPSHCQRQSVLDLPRLGSPKGESASPWTEVAMHLAEVLEPGHY